MSELEPILQKLREAGYKITGARRAVLSVLQESGGHLTSADVLAQVEAQDPSIGRASVFRALELLTGLAIIRPTFLKASTPTYVLMSEKGHHSHIVCTQCARIVELDECVVDTLTEQIEASYHIRLTGHLLEFYGTCEECSQRSKLNPESE
jgi:Fur family ferric uptake transcriptional regulator